MKHFIPTLTLVAALASPLAALADAPRAHSPARQMLHQMIDLPATRTQGHGQIQRHGYGRSQQNLAGEYSPRAVHTRRFGLIEIPDRHGSWFSIAHSGDLSFSIGCNRYWADANIRHGRIAIGPFASTRMACAPRETQLERRMIRALRNAETVRADHGGVRFMDHRGTTLLVLGGSTPPMRLFPRFGH